CAARQAWNANREPGRRGLVVVGRDNGVVPIATLVGRRICVPRRRELTSGVTCRTWSDRARRRRVSRAPPCCGSVVVSVVGTDAGPGTARRRSSHGQSGHG